MHFEEEIHVPVPGTQAWAFLWQPERVAACLPGCTSVVETEPRRTYALQFEDHIGPYRVHFDLTALVEEVVEGESIQLSCSGEDRRLGASQHVLLQVRLQPESATSTLLLVVADVELIGKIATLGQFAVKRKVRDVVKQFAANLQAELAPAPARAD